MYGADDLIRNVVEDKVGALPARDRLVMVLTTHAHNWT